MNSGKPLVTRALGKIQRARVRKAARKRLLGKRTQAARASLPRERAQHEPWSAAEIRILKGAAKNSKTGRYDWKGVATLLGAAGYVRTPAQCQCKFRSGHMWNSIAAVWPSLPPDPAAAAANPTWSAAQMAVHTEFLGLQQKSARLSAVWATQETAMRDTYKKHAEVLLAMRKCADFIS